MAASGHGISLGRLAHQFKLQLRGNPQHQIRGVATLASAGSDHLAFMANPLYRSQLKDTKAGVVVLSADDAEHFDGNVLIADDAYLAWAKLAAQFDRRSKISGGVHPSAVVDASAQIDDTAAIDAGVVVGERAVIGANVRIGAGSFIGADCHVGANSRLEPRVVLQSNVKLGQRVIIHPGAVIGADGFGLAFDGAAGQWIKVPQLGGVSIGDDSEVGANTTIDRGALEDTIIGCDVRLDNQIQIAHNVVVGDHTAMAGCSAVAGSARIGKYCMIAGGVGILGHLELCDRVTVTAMSLVTRSINKPGTYSSGTPLQDNAQWRRNAVRIRQLDDLARRVRRLEHE